MQHGQRRFSTVTRAVLITATIIVLLVGSMFVIRYYSRPKIYGRIVDERGAPISGASVTYRITYSNGFLGNERKPERFRTIEVGTDSNGDYCVRGIDGNFVCLAAVKLDEQELKDAMGVPCPVDTGWSLNDQSQLQRMPQSARQRITYSFKR